MLSFVKCTFPQAQRGRESKNWIFFSVVITIFIFSPSLSAAANEKVENLHQFSKNPNVPLYALSSTTPILPSGLLSSLLEEFHTDSTNTFNQITYQDPQASRIHQSVLQVHNFPISLDKSRNQWQPPQDQNKHLRSFTQPPKHEDHLVHPKAGQMPLVEVGVSHLTKRQQVDTGSTHSPYFPQPFDTSLGTEFESDTCQPFMSKFLNNPGFQDCHAFSLLLTTSDTFFRAYSSLNPANNNNADRETSIMPVKQVLDASCRADVNKCAELLDQLAVSINSSTIGCGKDLDKQNSLPLQALDGLKNYKLMRQVGCLTTTDSDDVGPRTQNGTIRLDNSTFARGSTNNSTLLNSTLSSTPRYCFEKAVSSDKPDDLYYYYLPLGTNLPSGTQSSCDQCIKSIMKLYSIDASNNSLALSKTYLAARTMTNSQCGPGFAPLPINMANRLASTAHRWTGTMPSASPLKFAAWIFIIINLLFLRI